MWALTCPNGSFDVASRPYHFLITTLTQRHSLFSIIVSIFALSSICLLHLSFKRHQAVRATYPPGPASWRVRVKEVLSRHYRQPTDRDYDYLHKTYGPLVMINRSSGMELLLGNDQVCEDLLVQRAHINSSRPAVAWHQSVRLLQNRDLMFWQVGQINKDWQQSRELLSSRLTYKKDSDPDLRNSYEQEVDLSINRIAQNFERSDQEIRRLSISLNTCAVFKIPVRDTQAAEFIKLEQMLQTPPSHVATMSQSISTIVDDILTRSRVSAEFGNSTLRFPQSYSSWGAEYPAVRTNSQSWKTKPFSSPDICLSEATLLGIRATHTVLKTFILAVLLHGSSFIPHARVQIDRLVGNVRAPRLSDRDGLPLVEAILRELLRWHPPLPFGLPHVTTCDDVYVYAGREYFIPRGTVLRPSICTMQHDRSTYDNPEVFNPQRHLDPLTERLLPKVQLGFGYGWRACPAEAIAQDNLFLCVVNLLWAFDISSFQTPDHLSLQRGQFDKPLDFSYKLTLRKNTFLQESIQPDKRQ